MQENNESLPHLAAAACLAGLAFDAGGLQFHALSHVLGARYHQPQGICCAMVLRAGLNHLLPRAPGKLARLAPIFASDIAAADVGHAAAAVVNGVIEFIDRMKVPYPRQVCDIEYADVDDLVRETVSNRKPPHQNRSIKWR